jgi:hypothetical protein
MTEDHEFIDSAGSSVSGKSAVTASWASFFTAFPDYRNEFPDTLYTGRRCASCRQKPLLGRPTEGPAVSPYSSLHPTWLHSRRRPRGRLNHLLLKWHLMVKWHLMDVHEHEAGGKPWIESP